MSRLNFLEETRFEKLPVKVYQDEHIASKNVARRIADLIIEKQSKNEKAVLGLATGATPVEVYEELVRLHKEEGLSFKNVVTFNLDEYYPMKPTSAQSYVTFMKENLFNHIDIDMANVHIPDGTLPLEDIADFCFFVKWKSHKMYILVGNISKTCARNCLTFSYQTFNC